MAPGHGYQLLPAHREPLKLQARERLGTTVTTAETERARSLREVSSAVQTAEPVAKSPREPALLYTRLWWLPVSWLTFRVASLCIHVSIDIVMCINFLLLLVKHLM